MDLRNASRNQFGTIDLEFNHPEYGWIPFTASPDDPEELGRALYLQASQGPVAPYVSEQHTPEQLRAAMPALTPRQLRLALLSINIQEADVDMKLVNDQAGMVEWKFATSLKRDHRLVAGLGALFEITPEQIDSLWTWAATL